jgi:hypothetical protein
VTLEGLRRLDEGIKPKEPSVGESALWAEDPDGVNEAAAEVEYDSNSPLPLSQTVNNAASGGGRSKMVFAAVAVAVVVLVAVIGIPSGWFSKTKTAVAAQPETAPAPEAQASNTESNNAEEPSQVEQPAVDPASADAASLNDSGALAARHAREAKERARMAEAARQNAVANSPAAPLSTLEAAKKPDAIKPGPKMVSVQVTYDEAGRVTQTSGGDGTAQRIARQKRFPAGKAGATTITIPIN